MDYFTELWRVKLGDFGRGLVIAVFTAPLTIIYASLTADPVTLIFDWKAIIGASLAAGVAYIMKNMATGSGGQMFTNSSKP